MTRNQAKSILDNIELVRAYAAGATLQKGNKNEWHDDQDPGFDPYHRWRVKPEPPKPREWWIVQTATQTFVFRSLEEACRNHYKRLPECMDEIIHVTESP